MIRCIVAIDYKRGIADNQGIPWKLPSDKKFFRDTVAGSTILMGYATYQEFTMPLPDCRNVVASSSITEPLREGFEITADAREFLKDSKEDIWVVGGARLFESTIDLADELYITQVQGDFNCTKFFPEFKNKFELKSEEKPITENGVTFTFQTWTKK